MSRLNFFRSFGGSQSQRWSGGVQAAQPTTKIAKPRLANCVNLGGTICLRQAYAIARRAFVLALMIGLWLGWAGGDRAWAENYTKVSLIGRNLAGQDLRDSEFTKANLRQSNLSGANLEGVSFFAANLEEVNLSGANLRNATLDSARLVEANLTHAVLEGAFAANAHFEGATITGADFTDVLLRKDTQAKLCAIAEGKNPQTGRETRETLFCP